MSRVVSNLLQVIMDKINWIKTKRVFFLQTMFSIGVKPQTPSISNRNRTNSTILKTNLLSLSLTQTNSISIKLRMELDSSNKLLLRQINNYPLLSCSTNQLPRSTDFRCNSKFQQVTDRIWNRRHSNPYLINSLLIFSSRLPNHHLNFSSPLNLLLDSNNLLFLNLVILPHSLFINQIS